jgi:hypothetical protein
MLDELLGVNQKELVDALSIIAYLNNFIASEKYTTALMYTLILEARLELTLPDYGALAKGFLCAPAHFPSSANSSWEACDV